MRLSRSDWDIIFIRPVFLYYFIRKSHFFVLPNPLYLLHHCALLSRFTLVLFVRKVVVEVLSKVLMLYTRGRIFICLVAPQVVFNANKLANLVEKKKKMRNWLDYYRLKYERKPSERPTTKV